MKFKIAEDIWSKKKSSFTNWEGETITKEEEIYSPRQDAKFKRLIKKPINTLTIDEIIYIFAIHQCWYMSQVYHYSDIDEAINEVKERWGNDFNECYEFLHSLSFPLTIYRAIRVGTYKSSEKSTDSNVLNISGKQQSFSWTTNPKIYTDNRSKFKNAVDIVACEIDSTIIDSESTIANYMYYTNSNNIDSSYGEYEVTLRNNFKQSDLHDLRIVDKNTFESVKGVKMKFHKVNNTLQERIYDDGTITDDETGEVLFTSSNDLYEYLVERFKSLTEQEIFELIGTYGVVETFDNGGAFFITPSGKIVNVNETLSENDMIHHDLLHYIVDNLYLKVTHQKVGGVEEVSGMDEEDFDWMLDDVLLDKLGWVRCNTGSTWIEDRFYCVLTDHSPKNAQWYALEEWMEWGELHKKDDVLVFFSPTGKPNKRYRFEDSHGFGYTAEEIIKLMKRYYASGVLYEDKEDSLNEDIENMKKYYPNIPEEEFMGYIQLDPTYKKGSTQAGKYAKWILGLANKGKIDNIELLAKVLVDFEEEKPHLVNADIMKYKSAEEVADMLDDESSYKELSHRQGVRQRQKARKYADLGEEAELVYEDADWEVWVPKTYAASCKLGQDTSWCTASTESDYHYNYYLDEYGGDYYINIDKHNPKRKYQFHFPTEQFMNASDQEIDITELLGKNEGLYKFYSSVVDFGDIALPSYEEYKALLDNDFTVTYYKDSNFEEIKTIVKKIIVDDSVHSIPPYAFENYEALEEVVMGDNISSIGNAAFRRCYGLKKVVLPKEIVSIGEMAFAWCENLEDIDIPKGLQRIKYKTFLGCAKLKHIDIPQGVITIGDEAFSYCMGLRSVGLPYGLIALGEMAFDSCEYMEKLIIPNTVNTINMNAFTDCPRLTVYTDNDYAKKYCSAYRIPTKPLDELKESMNINESSLTKDSIVLPDKTILSWGWEKGYNGGHYYVEKAYKISDTDELYQTEFHRIYATEQDAKRAYNRYRLKKESCDETLNEVYPNKGESKKDFISRFMSVTKDEYPDTKQRYAVALSYWDRRKKNEGIEDDKANLISFLDTVSFDDVDEEGIDKEIGKYSVSIWSTESRFGSAWVPHKVVNVQIDRDDMPNGYLGSTDIESEEELRYRIDRLKEKISR